VPANEFLNLEGDKISTSRNHAVWLHEYLEEMPGRRDELRYVLNSISPETKDADFTWKDYQLKVNSELVSILGNFVNRVMVLTGKYFEGKVPVGDGLDALNERHVKISQHIDQTKVDIQRSIQEMITSLKDFHFRDAQFQMMNIARAGNKFLAETEPWKLAKEDMDLVGTILNFSLQIVGNLALATAPFLPDGSSRMEQQLGELDWKEAQRNFWNNEQFASILRAGHTLGKPALLYQQVEDESIEFQVEKLIKAPVQQAASASALKPLKPTSTFDDFSKLDIRIGTVTHAEKMEKSNKLLKLTVNAGLDTRTILSGIAQHYSPEEMVGKQVTFIANLAPRKMMGIESQGMILMAEDTDGKLKLIHPSDNVTPGSTVS
jgi:methionyl-tRNA synthetase